MRAAARACLFCLVLASPACGPTVDLAKNLQVQDVSTGWFDAGLVDGKSKLVPSISLTLKNVSDQKLPVLQLNALFRRVTEKAEWGSGFITVAGSEGLAPGAAKTLTIKSYLGYTGSEQSRQEMLKNSYFVDAKVELFAKYASTQWVRIGDFPIERRLITR